ncbi:hypothetical protein ALC57_01461, partial [Trachymyrmex cornetzi]
HGLKKRKGLVECNLDDRLSSRQKDAIEEVTYLFPQMSPKSVVAETLRVLDIAGEAEMRTQTMKGDLRRQIKVGVNVAKIAMQRLVEDINKSMGPTDEIRENNLALEREVVKLRREMDALRRERTSLKDEVESLRRTVEDLRNVDGRRVRDKSRVPSSEEEGRIRGSPVSSLPVSEELRLGIVAIAEPNCIPDNGRWVASNDNPPSAAITWQWSRERVPCTPRWRGMRFAAVDWGDIIVVSCYFSPSLSEVEFSRDLYELENKLLGVRGYPVVIVGDFNARAPA